MKTRKCDICGTEFVPTNGRAKRCSPECRRLGKLAANRRYLTSDKGRTAHRAADRRYFNSPKGRDVLRRYKGTDKGREVGRAASQRRRARKREATVETFVDTEIFERDNWTCGICREAIDPALSHPDPMSASLDHIVPLAQGGSHERSNVQASHLVCNLRKGARPLEEVAA